MTARVFEPASRFIAGTCLTAQVDRWEWVPSRGLWVVYRDGLRCRSEYTLRALLAAGGVVEVTR